MKKLRTIKIWDETRLEAKILAAMEDRPMTEIFSDAIKLLKEKQCQLKTKQEKLMED